LPKTGIFNTSVFNNAAYGLKIRGMEKSEREVKTAAALKAAGLLHKARQNALTLSSGEAQRLGIARAMVLEPEVFFLDEPTASVDRKNTSVIEELIVRFQEQSSALVVMSTHDREQVRRLAGKRLAMEDGGVIPA
jgi:tungstate transport system ATP-binding protein